MPKANAQNLGGKKPQGTVETDYDVALVEKQGKRGIVILLIRIIELLEAIKDKK